MMNERIKQLAYQAMNFAEAIHGRFHEEHDPPNWDTFDAYEQKFAELIVAECCDQFVELRTRPADLAAKDVKKYFGVE
jgi:hypothetical protein